MKSTFGDSLKILMNKSLTPEAAFAFKISSYSIKIEAVMTKWIFLLRNASQMGLKELLFPMHTNSTFESRTIYILFTLAMHPKMTL